MGKKNPKLLGTVRQLNGNRKKSWQYQVTLPRVGRVTKHYATEDEAHAYQLEVSAKADDDTLDTSAVTVNQALDALIVDRERRNRLNPNDFSGYAVAVYKNAASYIRRRHGDARLKDMTRPAWQRLVNELSEHYAAIPAQVRNVLNCMYDHAMFEEEWGVRTNPLRDRPLKLVKPRKRQLPDQRDVVLLMETMMVRQRSEKGLPAIRIALISAAATMGVCRGELCGLQVSNVIFGLYPGAGVIKIRHNHSSRDGLKGPKKEARNRDVVMNPFVEKAMLRVHEQLGARQSGYFFVGTTGKPIIPEEVNHCYFKTPMQRAGLLIANKKGELDRPKFTFHDLRHVAASLMIAQGMNAVQVADVLGHSNPATTLNVYADLFRDVETSRRCCTRSPQPSARSVNSGFGPRFATKLATKSGKSLI